jgi:hypothetical protein
LVHSGPWYIQDLGTFRTLVYLKGPYLATVGFPYGRVSIKRDFLRRKLLALPLFSLQSSLKVQVSRFGVCLKNLNVIKIVIVIVRKIIMARWILRRARRGGQDPARRGVGRGDKTGRG